MRKFVQRNYVAAAVVLAFFLLSLPSVHGKQHGGTSHSSGQTHLRVLNPSNMGVYCIITVNEPGSITNIAVNGYSTWTTPPGPPLPTPSPPSASSLYLTCPNCPTLTQGFFYLAKGARVTISSTLAGNVLNGVSVAFLQPPDTCPGSSSGFYPYGAPPQITAVNGTNFAELTLNVATGETVDISCNKGANAKINVTTVGGLYWDLNGNSVAAFSTTNSWVDGATGADHNCGIGGVFPYQYTRCTRGPNACAGSPDNATCGKSAVANNGLCEFTRVPNATGGDVYVSFLGPEHPPQ